MFPSEKIVATGLESGFFGFKPLYCSGFSAISVPNCPESLSPANYAENKFLFIFNG